MSAYNDSASPGSEVLGGLHLHGILRGDFVDVAVSEDLCREGENGGKLDRPHCFWFLGCWRGHAGNLELRRLLRRPRPNKIYPRLRDPHPKLRPVLDHVFGSQISYPDDQAQTIIRGCHNYLLAVRSPTFRRSGY